MLKLLAAALEVVGAVAVLVAVGTFSVAASVVLAGAVCVWAGLQIENRA